MAYIIGSPLLIVGGCFLAPLLLSLGIPGIGALMVSALGVVVGVLGLVFALAAPHDQPPDQTTCEACDYDLTASISAHCPECGAIRQPLPAHCAACGASNEGSWDPRCSACRQPRIAITDSSEATPVPNAEA